MFVINEIKNLKCCVCGKEILVGVICEYYKHKDLYMCRDCWHNDKNFAN